MKTQKEIIITSEAIAQGIVQGIDKIIIQILLGLFLGYFGFLFIIWISEHSFNLSNKEYIWIIAIFIILGVPFMIRELIKFLKE